MCVCVCVCVCRVGWGGVGGLCAFACLQVVVVRLAETGEDTPNL